MRTSPNRSASESTQCHNLLPRFRDGDTDAFAEIYRLNSPAIFRFLLHMTADPAKAADLTQDVFVWLIHHAGDFDPDRGQLTAFLIGVARKFLQRLRHEETRWVPFDETAVDLSQQLQPDPDTSDTDRLRAAISLLPDRYRETVVLCDLEGQSYEEAAAALCCAVGTVRSRLHRARTLLARKLQPAPHSKHSEASPCSA